MRQEENVLCVSYPVDDKEAAKTSINIIGIIGNTDNTSNTDGADTDKGLINFLLQEGTALRRCFVMDSNIYALEGVKEFISKFNTAGRQKGLVTSFFYKRNLLLVVKAGEQYKTLESAKKIVMAALAFGLNRQDSFIAIGGGVITDLTAFVASIYKRGVQVSFIPTTLLCMVDASVGGKTAVDIKGYKNIIGSFYPATTITCYIKFIKTLTDTQYKAGLIEAIKMALLYDREFYNYFLTNKERIIARDKECVLHIVTRAMQLKISVVEKDFHERCERKMLNLGHTFAHAAETCIKLTGLSHGEAVAWGIYRAALLSYSLGLCKEDYVSNIYSLLSMYGYNTHANPYYKTSEDEEGVSLSLVRKLVKVMHSDKKNTSDYVTFILQEGIEKNKIVEVENFSIMEVLQEDKELRS